MVRLVPLTLLLATAGWSLTSRGDAGAGKKNTGAEGASVPVPIPVLPPGVLKKLEKGPCETSYPVGRWVRGSFGPYDKDGTCKGIVVRCMVARGDEVEGGYCYQVEIHNKTGDDILFGWGLLDVMDGEGDGKGPPMLYAVPKGKVMTVELHSEDAPVERFHGAVFYLRDEKTNKLMPFAASQSGALPQGVAGRKSL